MEDPVKFSTLYTGGNHVPARSAETHGENGAAAAHSNGRPVHIHQFTAAPVLDTLEAS